MSTTELTVSNELRTLAEQSNAWPFEQAKAIVARLKRQPKDEVLFETGYGPSGLPHMGTFGEVARTTMVRQGDGWLLDTLYVLKADSVPLAAAGEGWPGPRARTALDAVSRDRTVAAGSLVESGLRAGAAAGEIYALAVVADCSPGSCTANDGVGVHRLRLRQTGGGWQVAGTERL